MRPRTAIAIAAPLAALAVAAALLAPAAASALDRRILVSNYSSQAVVAFWYSARDYGGWGPDRFDGFYLMPGYNTVVDVNDGSGYCIMDMKALGEYGGTWTIRMNVCEQTGWNLYD